MHHYSNCSAWHQHVQTTTDQRIVNSLIINLFASIIQPHADTDMQTVSYAMYRPIEVFNRSCILNTIRKCHMKDEASWPGVARC